MTPQLIKPLHGWPFPQGLYAEKWAPFVKELAVMVVRQAICSLR
jgi:phosphoribosylaminoimidazole carboxylase (NCAIR synthetase)